MARYLVTGAAGFIASRVCKMLIDDGHTVLGVDNVNNAYDVRMKEYRLRQLQLLPGFSFERLDITNMADLAAVYVEPFDAVINLAARAGVRQSLENPWEYYNTNVIGTLNLLELCHQKDIAKFILASTSSVYGLDAVLPTPEQADSDHPIQPYAASKKAAEVLCYTYHSLYGLDVTVFRYFTVYGPSGRPDMSMFRFVQWIREGRPVRLYGDGEQTRGFTFVDDIARGTILGLKPLGYEVINLGGHESIKINSLIEMIEELVGKTAKVTRFPPHPADMLANWADVSKAEQLLGWKPLVPLSSGVAELVAWYNTERNWLKGIATD
jgi:UDP-glucuronate 4-epimerase